MQGGGSIAQSWRRKTEEKPNLLVVDDDESFRFAVKRYFGKAGYLVSEAGSLEAGRAKTQAGRVDALLLDLRLPDGSGLDWIAALRERDPGLALVVITGDGDVPVAVEAMRRGADHFACKPVSFHDLEVYLSKAGEMSALRRRDVVRRRLARPTEFFPGCSAASRELMSIAEIAAGDDSSVLLLGESGTGKGLLARWIHEASCRKASSFVEINCSSLRGELLANELYGHSKGAFTSATEPRPGLLDAADKGTLFLDEVADMDPAVQTQFLKTIEEKSFRRMGEVGIRFSDFRLICATNKDLDEECIAGRFRRDLYYRIHVFPIRLPALRERPDDIPDLIGSLLRSLGASMDRIDDCCLPLLVSYSWPGNVRELRNVLERALLMSRGGRIIPSHLPCLTDSGTWADAAGSRSRSGTIGREAIEAALRQSGGHKGRAAKILGVSRATFYRHLRTLR